MKRHKSIHRENILMKGGFPYEFSFYIRNICAILLLNHTEEFRKFVLNYFCELQKKKSCLVIKNILTTRFNVLQIKIGGKNVFKLKSITQSRRVRC